MPTRRRRPESPRLSLGAPSSNGARLDPYLESLLRFETRDSRRPQAREPSRLPVSDPTYFLLDDLWTPRVVIPDTYPVPAPIPTPGTRFRAPGRGASPGRRPAMQAVRPRLVRPHVVSKAAIADLKWQWPARVWDCYRRKLRRMVMFSQRVAGRRGSAPGKRRHYKRTQSSAYRC